MWPRPDFTLILRQVCIRAKWLMGAVLIPAFCNMK